MRKQSFIIGILACALLVPAVASMQTVTIGQERITLNKGSVFEMIVASPDLESTTTWTLVKEDTFVSSERGTYFQNRFTEAGNFELRIEYASSGEQRIRNVDFTINDREPEEVPSGFDVGLDTVPPAKAGSILLSPRRRIIELQPQPGVDSVTFDFLSNIDTSGDNNPTNDNDIETTLLASGKAPLFVWFPDDFSKKTISYSLNGRDTEYLSLISLVASNPNNKPIASSSSSSSSSSSPSAMAGSGSSSSSSSVTSSSSSSSSSQNNGGLEIVTREDADGGWNIKMLIPKGAENTLVPHWDFGDGFQSLEAEPVHKYRKAGTYTVTGHVYDIEAGEVLRSITTQVTAKAADFKIPPTISSGASSSTVSSISSQETSSQSSDSSEASATSSVSNQGEAEDASRGILGWIGIAFWLLAIVVAFMLMFWLLRKVWKMFKGGDHFQKALTSMEAQLVPSTNKEAAATEATVPAAAPQVQLGADPLAAPNSKPVQSSAAAPTTAVTKKAEPAKATTPPTPAPKVAPPKQPLQPKPEALKADPAKAPDWLSAGLTTDAAKKETPKPAITPTPATPSTAKPEIKKAPAPEVKKQAPPAAPKVEPTKTPTPSSTPATSDTSATSKDVPDWLKPAGDNSKATPTPATPSTAKPEVKKAPASEVKKQTPPVVAPVASEPKIEPAKTSATSSSSSTSSTSVPDWLKPAGDTPKAASAVAKPEIKKEPAPAIKKEAPKTSTPPAAAKPAPTEVKKEAEPNKPAGILGDVFATPTTPAPVVPKPATPKKEALPKKPEAKKEAPQPATPAPAPAAPKPAPPPPTPASAAPKVETAKTSAPSATSDTSAASVPDWLKPKKGMPKATPAPATPKKEAPKPVAPSTAKPEIKKEVTAAVPEVKKETPKPATPPPTPASAAPKVETAKTSAPSATSDTSAASVPDWLKPAGDKPKAAPEPEVKKEITPASAAPITSKMEPAKTLAPSTTSSPPETSTTSVPDWLKPATTVPNPKATPMVPPAEDTDRKQKFMDLAKENSEEQGV